MSTFTQWMRSLNGPALFAPGAPSYFKGPAGLFATPAVINNGVTDAAALATTVAFTFANKQLAGDTIVVQVGWATAAITISTIVDTSGNTYTLQANSAQTGAIVSVYIAKNIAAAAAGANTLTVTFSSTGSVNRSLSVIEYSGIDLTYGVSAFNLTTATSATQNPGTVTPQDQGIVVSGVYGASGTVSAAPAGFNQRDPGVNVTDGMADLIPAVPGVPSTPIWTLSASVVGITWVLVLRASFLGAGQISPSGSGVVPVIYQDKAAQWEAYIRSSIAAPVINVEALMPGDNPPANWVLISALTVPAGLTTSFGFLGPALAVRLNWASAGAGAIVFGDLMWTEFEFY